MPIEVIQTQTIDYCNRSCLWCPNKDDIRKTRNLMTVECFEDIVDQAKKIPTLKTFKPFVMCEPLADPRIFEFIELLSKELPTVKITMDTNADYLRDEEILKKFKRSLSNPMLKVCMNIYDKEMLAFSKKLSLPKGNWFWRERLVPWKALWNRGGNLKGLEVKGRQRQSCFIMNFVNVNYKGDIMHCCSDYKFESILGTVSAGIVKSYNSEPWVTYREKYICGNADDIPVCKNCSIRKVK